MEEEYNSLPKVTCLFCGKKDFITEYCKVGETQICIKCIKRLGFLIEFYKEKE